MRSGRGRPRNLLSGSRSACLLLACAAVVIPRPASLAAQDRTFAPAPDYILGLDRSRSASLTLADIDGDGDLDILVANGRHWPQQNLAFLNHGAPRDAEHVPPGEGYGRFMEAFPVGPEMTTSYAIPAGDIDGDGDPDLVVANDRAPNQVYRNVGGRFELAGYLAPAPDLSRDAHLADFDARRSGRRRG